MTCDLKISVAKISSVNKVFFILILTPCQERLKQSLSMRYLPEVKK